MYRKAEKELPNGWALDKDGNPSIDAPDVLDNIAIKSVVDYAFRWFKRNNLGRP